MTKRTLSLKRETLTDLTNDDLTTVIGGARETLNIRCVPSYAQHTCIDCLTRSGC